MAKANDTTRISITNHSELFTALVGEPEHHEYHFPWDIDLLTAIDRYLNRQIYENASAIAAIGQVFVAASDGYYGGDCSLNQDEVLLCAKTRDLMKHVATLARQITDDREIRDAFSIELQRRQTQGPHLEKHEERFPDEFNKGLFLFDVSCKIQEAAVVLKYAYDEYVNEGSEDAGRLSAISALAQISRHLDDFGGEFNFYGGGEISDLPSIVSIVESHARDITSQADGLLKHVGVLDTRTNKDVLGHGAHRLLSEAGNELKWFTERYKDQVSASVKQGDHSDV